MSKHRKRQTPIHPKLRHWRWTFKMPAPTSRERCGSLELVAPSGHVAASVYLNPQIGPESWGWQPPKFNWFVWDRVAGCGGENSGEPTVIESCREAELAVIRWGKFKDEHYTRKAKSTT